MSDDRCRLDTQKLHMLLIPEFADGILPELMRQCKEAKRLLAVAACLDEREASAAKAAWQTAANESSWPAHALVLLRHSDRRQVCDSIVEFSVLHARLHPQTQVEVTIASSAGGSLVHSYRRSREVGRIQSRLKDCGPENLHCS